MKTILIRSRQFTRLHFMIALVAGTLGIFSDALASDNDEVVLHVAVNGSDSQDGSDLRPLQTLAAAQQRVQQIIARSLKQNIRVVIHAGTYELERPLNFGAPDSMSQGLFTSYEAAKEGSVVISGGLVVTQWKTNGGSQWTAKVADANPDLASNQAGSSSRATASWNSVRQLFRGDDCLIRARSPNHGYFRVAKAGPDRRTSFQYDPAEWNPPEQVQGVEVALLHDWSMSRIRMASADRNDAWIQLANRVGAQHDFFCIDGFEPHPRFFVENSLALLDSPGEFYFAPGSNEFLVQLPANQSPERIPVVAPRLTELIQMTGTPENPVRGLRFVGIQFRHTACPIPETGCAEIQASFFERRPSTPAGNAQADSVSESGHARLPAACSLTCVDDCRWERCQFRQLGGGGIYLDRQTNGVEIDGCSFSDIGGSGIMIGETMTRTGTVGQDLTCHDNVVDNCRVQRCGRVLLGSVGIWVGIARDTQIHHNEVSEMPYTGISVGWRWDAEPTGCRGNKIVGNHIHDVMQELSDGAGIYTLGLQPGTVLSANRIHHISINAGRAESNGIFMDEGSSQILVEQNVIDHVARSPIRFHKAGVNTIRNNRLFVDHEVAPFTFNSTDQNSLIFEHNETLDQSAAPKNSEPLLTSKKGD